MARVFNRTPRLEPGIVHQLDEDYFKRVEAIEFAVKYDDGRDSRGISRADIVLIGVSRTSKTPLSQYLAHKRLKVANVPVMPEEDVPEELFDLDPKKDRKSTRLNSSNMATSHDGFCLKKKKK